VLRVKRSGTRRDPTIFDFDVIEVILKHGTFPLKADDVNFLKMMSEKAFKLLENYTK
jgi:hypothetical protein